MPSKPRFREKKLLNLPTHRDALGLDLKRYWNEEKGYILTTLDRDGGLDYKYSNLDSSVILAVLHTGDSQNLFSVSDDKILSTAEKLKSTFGGLYPINRQYQNQKSGAFLAPGIGRYAEDRYDGVGNSEGHPWFLATMALSEFHYRLAAQMQKQGKITITPRSFNFFKDISPSLLHSKQLTSPRTITAKDAVWNQLITDIIRAGDSFAERTRYHSADDGSLAEQFNRHTGFMRGASDLTWSYASVLTAWYARLSAEQK